MNNNDRTIQMQLFCHQIFMTDNCTTGPTGGLQLSSSNWLTKQETAKMLLLRLVVS